MGCVLAGLDAHARAANCRLDMQTLARSVLLPPGADATPLPVSVAGAIAAYSDSDADAVRTLAAAVWAAAKGSTETTVPVAG